MPRPRGSERPAANMAVPPAGPAAVRAGAAGGHYNIGGRNSPRRLRAVPVGGAPMRRTAANDLAGAVRRFASDPARNWPIGVALLAVVLVAWWASRPTPDGPATSGGEAQAAGLPANGEPGDYLFCFWNVENLFDDREDQRPPVDRPYDAWFA